MDSEQASPEKTAPDSAALIPEHLHPHSRKVFALTAYILVVGVMMVYAFLVIHSVSIPYSQSNGTGCSLQAWQATNASAVVFSHVFGRPWDVGDPGAIAAYEYGVCYNLTGAMQYQNSHI